MTYVAVVLAAAALFGYLLYRVHQRKKTQQRVSYYVTTKTLLVSVPARLSEAKGRALAEALDAVIRWLWMELCEIYDRIPNSRYVGVVHVVDGEAAPGHPSVVWRVGGDIIRLSYGDDMLYYFAAEIHNVFRYGLHGYDGIYNTVDEEDRRAALEAQELIEKRYRGGE